MKFKHLAIPIILLAFFAAFWFSRDASARFLWHNWGRADLALALNRGDADLALQIGHYYFGATSGRSEYDLKKAEKSYKKALAARPGILWGHYQLARIYFVKGNSAPALGEINKELEANPENRRSLYIRGLIYGYSGNLTEAEEDFKNFVKWAPKEWAGYNDLAWILLRRGKYEEAKKTILAALSEVKGGEENPWLLNNLGLAELNLKEYSLSKSFFEKARVFAEKIGPPEWREAYPGNNPADAERGIAEFKKAISENLRIVSAVDNK